MRKLLYLLLCTVLITGVSSYKPVSTTFQFPFQDRALTIDQRVNDLVARLTLAEKVGQMLNAAPAVERLGIPAYNWWNESLHGIARTPFKVTVYPQAIGMAATFDVNAMHQMAEYTADEGRAVYNESVKANRRGIYLGLTYWTPNINIFRDPRWGRGQETYGEDPYLTANLGKSFVTGLQGNDPVYLKAAACAKHYAVHSGPEPVRHEFNTDVSNYDLWDTYLPAFHDLIVESKVAGVMCAYNAFRGEPCCGSGLLLNDILRKQWNFNGYLTSDCGAIDDFYQKHKTHADAEAAAADAVLHGTDVECGNVTYLSLVKAVEHGKITEQQIDVSLKRLFTIRFRLGMFDPPGQDKYGKIGAEMLETPEHKAHALKMARQSIVLLKNQNNTLPLSKRLKKVAVIGPNADNPISVLGNYNGMPSAISTPYQAIKAKLGSSADVYYDQAISYTSLSYTRNVDLGTLGNIGGQKGFKAEYWQNNTLSGAPVVTRQETALNYIWRDGTFVVGSVSQKNFSARWTTDFTANSNDEITFELTGNKPYKLIIDGEERTLSGEPDGFGPKTYALKASKGKNYHIVMEYRQTEGRATFNFKSGVAVKSDLNAIVQSVKDADAIVYVGGISPQLEGEEMRVNQPGFNGGDRTSIDLPKVQTDLLKALQTTGKPVVFVMMTGSAIAIPWEAEHIPAIMNAWYGGQSAGTAIADVLFGDYNPAGRLPVTFYKSDKDLPSFNSYAMDNRTYRYFGGQPLYGFGYGLSYTTFKYGNLTVPLLNRTNKNIPVSVKVTNTGKMGGEEVVQLYISHRGLSYKTPVRALKGFKRIYLKAGESKAVTFTLTPKELAVIDDIGHAVQQPGKLSVSVGGAQPSAQTRLNYKTVERIIQIRG
ncbi:glycoside hydrolase family 3 C-terminal domain-containing protein [Mucilaginibacter sp. PAMB04168]|uniref:glycoside hydrolase family 3 C-terminal domain-containing protein n=1 Tax=Mucilaginibacter sp. PAMB04168 TaxID=3138567 RepID=UPI0031F68ED2